MKVSRVFASGRVCNYESVEQLLKSSNAITTPNLTDRLNALRCPAHAVPIDGITLQDRQLTEEEIEIYHKAGIALPSSGKIVVVLFDAKCDSDGCCEEFDDIAQTVFDQDQDRAMEFFDPSSGNLFA